MKTLKNMISTCIRDTLSYKTDNFCHRLFFMKFQIKIIEVISKEMSLIFYCIASIFLMKLHRNSFHMKFQKTFFSRNFSIFSLMNFHNNLIKMNQSSFMNNYVDE